jgi:hypothetical protein
MRSPLPIIVASLIMGASSLNALAQHTPIQPAPPAAPQPGVRAVPIVVVRLNGDLVATRLVGRLREELDGAAANNAELVVLSIEGYRWRANVVRALADVVSASKVPVAALLGPSSPLGGGQTLVALAANSCWISAMASIKCEPADEVVIPAVAGTAITPEPSPAADIVTRHGLPAGMGAVLLAPTTPTYATWEGSERVVTLHEGTPPANGVALVSRETSGIRTRISSDQAVRLGIAKASAMDPGAVLRGLSLRASTVVTRLVAEDLAARKAELHTQLTAARTLTSQASDRLSSTPKGDDPADQDKRRKAGQSAVLTCQRAAEALGKAEAVAKDYAELLVEPPPGTTAVGITPEGSVKAWVAAFKDAQGDLAKVAERAARAAETKR